MPLSHPVSKIKSLVYELDSIVTLTNVSDIISHICVIGLQVICAIFLRQ